MDFSGSPAYDGLRPCTIARRLDLLGVCESKGRQCLQQVVAGPSLREKLVPVMTPSERRLRQCHTQAALRDLLDKTV